MNSLTLNNTALSPISIHRAEHLLTELGIPFLVVQEAPRMLRIVQPHQHIDIIGFEGDATVIAVVAHCASPVPVELRDELRLELMFLNTEQAFPVASYKADDDGLRVRLTAMMSGHCELTDAQFGAWFVKQLQDIDTVSAELAETFPELDAYTWDFDGEFYEGDFSEFVVEAPKDEYFPFATPDRVQAALAQFGLNNEEPFHVGTEYRHNFLSLLLPWWVLGSAYEDEHIIEAAIAHNRFNANVLGIGDENDHAWVTLNCPVFVGFGLSDAQLLSFIRGAHASLLKEATALCAEGSNLMADRYGPW